MFQILDPRSRNRLRALAIGYAVLLSAAVGRGEVVSWGEPAIDTWAYTNGFGGGFRDLTPSFSGAFLDEEDTGFLENGSGGPARLGSMLMAFETLDQIDAGNEPHRYAIRSATVTVRLQASSGGALPYSTQPVTPTSLLAEATTGGITTQKPFELFGVGFRNGYDGFALGLDQSGVRFSESSSTYAASGYSVFPAATDSAGSLIDVANNLTGGFSATETDSHTDPFAASPWAIGEVDVVEGAILPANTTVSFDINLSQPGVNAYLQRSLAGGTVGFFLSSLHPAGQFGSGGGAYPQWYVKEAVGAFAGAEAPTLSLDYEILPIPGDYDANGMVEAADHTAWSAAYGEVVATPGTVADGNGDGVVDSADYTVWRDAFSAAAVVVPEPKSGVYALAGLATLAFCTGTCVLTSPRRPKP